MTQESATHSEAKKWTWPTWITWENVGAILIALLFLTVVGLLVFRLSWVTSIENYEMCYTFDHMTGEVEITNEQGWVVRNPFTTSVHSIDLRPHQITISANQRVLNAKLCRFNPEGFKTFMEWHGRGAEKNLQEILKCYAYDSEGGRDCPFLEVVQDITANQAGGRAIQKAKEEKK